MLNLNHFLTSKASFLAIILASIVLFGEAQPSFAQEPKAQTQDPLQPKAQTQDPLQPKAQTQDPLQPKAQTQDPLQPKAQTQDPLQPKAQTQDPLQPKAQTQDPLDPNAVSLDSPESPSEVSQRPAIPTEIKLREFDGREKIALLLSSHCSLPSREDMLITSPQAESHLQSIIEDEGALVSVRMRALDALSYFPSPENAETLRTVLTNPKQSEERRILVRGMRAYLRLVGAEAATVLETFLTHPDSFVRLVAIRSLTQCPGALTLSILQKHERIEESRFFKTKLAQAIENHCKGNKVCIDKEM